MRLKRLVVKNFCQHRELAVEFPPGVTRILGGNGRGKSNLVKAIKFAILGESGNAGGKADDLNWQAATDKEPGYVELSFEINGTEGVIKRSIQAARVQMTFGQRKIGKAVEANAAMLDLSGITKRTFDDIIFVMQGKLESVLFERPAERAAKFQGLFGTENAEKIRELLMREMSLLNTESLDDRVGELQKSLATVIDPELKSLDGQLRSIQESQKQFLPDALDIIIQEFKTSEEIARQIVELERQEAEYRRALGDSRALDAMIANVDRLYARVESEKQRAEMAQATLANLQNIKSANSVRQALLDDIAACEQTLMVVPPSPPTMTEEQLASATQQVIFARASMSRMQQFVEAFESGKPICPTCGQLVTNVEAKVESTREAIAEKEMVVAQVEQMISSAREELDSYRKHLLLITERQEEASRRLKDCKERLAAFGDAQYADVDEEKLRRLVHDFTKLSAELEENSKLAAKAKESHALTTGKLQSIREQLEQLTAKTSRFSKAQYEAAVQAKAQLDSLKLAAAELEGRIKQLHNQRVQTLAELEGLSAQSGQLENKRKYKLLCERAREILHRDVLPLRVTRKYLAALNAKIAEYLGIFDSPFGCKIMDDLSVICNFHNVPDQPAERLSGGQKVMLGIAFRFAIYSLFARTLGFVVLDEPTVMLDSHNVSIISDLMDRIRGYVLNAGLQLVVVTHEQQLMTQFDSTITV